MPWKYSYSKGVVSVTVVCSLKYNVKTCVFVLLLKFSKSFVYNKSLPNNAHVIQVHNFNVCV